MLLAVELAVELVETMKQETERQQVKLIILEK
jgi:hypothetical protein